jgi:hypothetical protein
VRTRRHAPIRRNVIVKKILVILAAATALLACGGGDDSSEPLIEFPLGGEVKLGLGQAGSISSEGVRLQFREVSEDSRCPLNALCIQAGKATVQVEASKSGVGSQTVAVTVGSGDGFSLFAGYRIQLVQLDPYPVAGQPIVPANYVATLKVSR